MSKRFQKKVEDFVCEQCGCAVSGNGYTNHCPRCLWSKHVDVFPGDRAHLCKGLMEPVDIHIRAKECDIIHRCVRCGIERINKTAEHDNAEILARLAQPKR